MTCFMKTGSCIELGVSGGNSASLLYLALAWNTAWCQTDHSQEDWPSSLASGKKMLLTLRQVLLAWGVVRHCRLFMHMIPLFPNEPGLLPLATWKRRDIITTTLPYKVSPLQCSVLIGTPRLGFMRNAFLWWWFHLPLMFLFTSVLNNSPLQRKASRGSCSKQAECWASLSSCLLEDLSRSPWFDFLSAMRHIEARDWEASLHGSPLYSNKSNGGHSVKALILAGQLRILRLYTSKKEAYMLPEIHKWLRKDI